LRQIAAATYVTAAPSTTQAELKSNYTLGIYQSIGYKEFHDYLSAENPPQRAFNAAVEHMKVSTRQYAKRQVSWIRNKLLPAVYVANAEQVVVPTYLLDATVLGDHWNKNVKDLAVSLTEGFLANKELLDPLSLSENAKKMMNVDRKPVDPISVLTARQKRVCHACTIHVDRPYMVEDGREWEVHCKSRAHRRLAAQQKKGDTVKHP